MKKVYDFNFIERYIEIFSKHGLKSVTLGMFEDWSWTADVFWTKEHGWMREMEPCDEPNHCIMGINGSIWATPVMEVEFEGCPPITVEVYREVESQPLPTSPALDLARAMLRATCVSKDVME